MIPNRALVLGIGSTGESCTRFLNGRSDLYVTDTRVGYDDSISERFKDLQLVYGDTEFIEPRDVRKVLDSNTVVYASPGIPLHDPIFDAVRASGSRISCDVELFCSLVDAPLIGITGTNGKTTTTELTTKMLRSKGFVSGGNIGKPVLDLLEQPEAGYVLEISSFQLEKMNPPHLRGATVLNVTEDHQDHHRDFDEYAAVKARIYEQCDVAVYNTNDINAKPLAVKSAIPVNGTNDWCVRDHEIVIAGEIVPIENLHLKGAPNHLNIVLAAALAHVCGASSDELVKAAMSYEGLPHRMQLIAEIEGVRYVNDSKATNVAATRAALESLSNGTPNVVLLAGGDGKGANFEPLSESIRHHAKAAILFGRDANTIATAVGDVTEYVYTDSMEAAVKEARGLAKRGDVVLLSPACASFDMYSDYVERGNQFISTVKAMAS